MESYLMTSRNHPSRSKPHSSRFAACAVPRTGTYRHGFPLTERGILLKICRADVADFVLKQLSDDTYLFNTPGVST